VTVKSFMTRARLILPTLGSAGVAVVLSSVMAFAQVTADKMVPLGEARPQAELSPGPLVYGAYAFVWAAVVAYVFMLWRRVGRVERELQDVRGRLAARR